MEKGSGQGPRPKLTLAYTRRESEAASDEAGGKNTAREHLEYIADTIRHMQVLAWHTGCSRLAELLEMAHREADRERRARPTRLSWLGPA